jgi:hypothetical protein
MKNWYSTPIPKKRREWAARLEWIYEQRKNGMQVYMQHDCYWFKESSDLVLYLLTFQK